MPKSESVKSTYRFFFSPGMLLTLFIFFYLLFLIRSDLVKYFELVNEKKILKENIVNERARQQACLKMLSRLETTSYLEELARVKLGFIKEGEAGYKVY
jgi:cell division protein FtsB